MREIGKRELKKKMFLGPVLLSFFVCSFFSYLFFVVARIQMVRMNMNFRNYKDEFRRENTTGKNIWWFQLVSLSLCVWSWVELRSVWIQKLKMNDDEIYPVLKSTTTTTTTMRIAWTHRCFHHCLNTSSRAHIHACSFFHIHMCRVWKAIQRKKKGKIIIKSNEQEQMYSSFHALRSRFSNRFFWGCVL